MIGSNLNEWTTIFPSTRQQAMTDAQKKLYQQAYPNEDPATADLVDTYFRPTTLEIMDHKAQQN